MSREHGRADAAVAAARGVVGLYGDPEVSWSIGLEAQVDDVPDVEAARRRLDSFVAARPWLGASPDFGSVADTDLAGSRSALLDDAYADTDPLVRVVVCPSQAWVMVAGHHGAVDGAGLLALMATVLDVPLTSGFLGIGDREAAHGFLGSAARRLGEALFAPPTRLAVDAGPGEARESGDHAVSLPLPELRVSTGTAAAAGAAAVTRWNREHGRRAGRLVLAIGASRRPGTALEADRDTAYLRVRVPRGGADDEVRAAVAAAAPEPTFPAVRAPGPARMLTRLLAGRLGSTLLLSNLGAVSGTGLDRLTFWPPAAGRPGVAVGLVSVAGRSTTLSLRVRRADLDEPAARRFLDLVAASLPDA
ncbi:MAG: hypothetical protein QOJ90_2016 [Actinomycetota bacterium]|nr:hypothetical protein [Actinomycetota bacterium]